MKIQELTIGNWVCIAKPHKITGMQICDGVPCIQTDYTDTYYAIDNYEPIPLTIEILEKNGFEKSYDEILEMQYYRSQDKTIQITHFSNSVNKDWYVHIDNDCYDSIGSCDIQYVHELQNLLTLCNLDIEITL